jgi:hypothetical protein
LSGELDEFGGVTIGLEEVEGFLQFLHLGSLVVSLGLPPPSLLGLELIHQSFLLL